MKEPAPAPAPAPSIVGRWKEPGSADTTEFRADGTLIETSGNGESIRGRYSLDGSKLKINLEGVPDELSFAASVKTDELETTDPDGQVTRFRRV
ncbi:MAG TPA: hypothetical protein VF551_04700 [Chthoniobacterales bacterium]